MAARDNLFVAGDLTGIEEAGTALDEGRIAGLAVALRSGALTLEYARMRIAALRESLLLLRSGRNGWIRREGKAELVRRHAAPGEDVS